MTVFHYYCLLPIFLVIIRSRIVFFYLLSSRSVPANISEAWVKRKYPKSFVSKLLDSLAEESETEVWIDMSKDCKYIDDQVHKSLLSQYEEVAKMLNSMINNPDKFCN
jgi:four helix bundle protein